jgi:G:T-mismatch repair DNA endonuclease (very short patch repair protein)
MKNPVVRKLWEKKMKGEANPAKRPEVKEKIREKNLPILQKFWHGVNNPFYGKKHTQSALIKIREARMKQKIPTSLTAPEKRFIEICKKYNLPFKYTGDGSFWIGFPPMNPDFIGTNEKIMIEVLGDYWHTQEEFEERRKRYAKYGFKCIGIWEHELSKSEQEIVRKVKCQSY